MWINEHTQFVRDRSLCEIRFHDIDRKVTVWAKPSTNLDHESGTPERFMQLLIERDVAEPGMNKEWVQGLASRRFNELPFPAGSAPDGEFQGEELSRWLRSHIEEVTSYVRPFAEHGFSEKGFTLQN